MNDFLEAVKKQSRKSQLEESFAEEMRIFGLPTPVRQFRFHPVRKWRFDFAWPEHKIGLEINGGIFIAGGKGGHNRGAYMEQTFDKCNAAQMLGWKVFIFGPSQVRMKKRTMQASVACEFLYEVLVARRLSGA